MLVWLARGHRLYRRVVVVVSYCGPIRQSPVNPEAVRSSLACQNQDFSSSLSAVSALMENALPMLSSSSGSRNPTEWFVRREHGNV